MDGGAGYDCSFVQPPPEEIETECPICLLVLREPSQVECCGRVFCTSCLRQSLRDGSDSCPMCSARSPSVFADQNLRRILSGYWVYCVHGGRGEGCEWAGELGQLRKHLNPQPGSEHLGQGCQFVTISCPLCGVSMQRSAFPDHEQYLCPKRTFSCPHCKLLSNFENISNNHMAECPCLPSRCPHCTETFQRRDLRLHLDNECVLAPVPCLFLPVGCQEELLRLELGTHLKKSAIIHAQLLLDTEGEDEGGEHVALFRSTLCELCRENSELSTQKEVLAALQIEERERIVKLENIQLLLILAVAVLLLVVVVLATKT